MVRLTQMKWKGTVSHCPKTIIPTRFSTVKTPQATSSQAPLGASRRSPSSGRDAISFATDGDDRVCAQLGSQPAHVDVDDVRPRIEVVAPDAGQQSVLRDRLAGVLHELPKQQELALGQPHRTPARLRRAAHQVELQDA